VSKIRLGAGLIENLGVIWLSTSPGQIMKGLVSSGVRASIALVAAASIWSPAPTLSGSLDFYTPYNGFKGTGSYFARLQAGYNQMFGSRMLLGAEADIWRGRMTAGLCDD
jgi:hypothetical protein